MKLINLSAVLIIGLLVAGTASGCKTKKSGATPLPRNGGIGLTGGNLGEGNRLGQGDGFDSTLSSAPGGGEAAEFDPDQMNQDRDALAAYTVYFGYDSHSIAPGEQSKMESVAAALRSDASARLLVEGHCDERGTEEYNRSLGDRRALTAREVLAGMGVEPARVATRTYGEDRPADPGQGESAWARNRRAEFILLHPR
ncbi:MAG TPA: OmpA family protein [Verrucomicrobiae bacterium]|nr:OmpA family protein [Verrucomicrobiae bacterium]